MVIFYIFFWRSALYEKFIRNVEENFLILES